MRQQQAKPAQAIGVKITALRILSARSSKQQIKGRFKEDQVATLIPMAGIRGCEDELAIIRGL